MSLHRRNTKKNSSDALSLLPTILAPYVTTLNVTEEASIDENRNPQVQVLSVQNPGYKKVMLRRDIFEYVQTAKATLD